MTEDLIVIQSLITSYFFLVPVLVISVILDYLVVLCNSLLDLYTKLHRNDSRENYRKLLTRLRFLECLIKGYLLITEKGNRSNEEKNLSCVVQQRVSELTLELYSINIQFSPI